MFLLPRCLILLFNSYHQSHVKFTDLITIPQKWHNIYVIFIKLIKVFYRCTYHHVRRSTTKILLKKNTETLTENTEILKNTENFKLQPKMLKIEWWPKYTNLVYNFEKDLANLVVLIHFWKSMTILPFNWSPA